MNKQEPAMEPKKDWVGWVDPFGPPVYCCVSKETVIAHMRNVYPHNLLTDELLLEDFIIAHRAEMIERPEWTKPRPLWCINNL